MSAPLRPSYESELEARIAELEAEREKWHSDAVRQTRLRIELEAERDRLATDADYWMKRATRNMP